MPCTCHEKTGDMKEWRNHLPIDELKGFVEYRRRTEMPTAASPGTTGLTVPEPREAAAAAAEVDWPLDGARARATT